VLHCVRGVKVCAAVDCNKHWAGFWKGVCCCIILERVWVLSKIWYYIFLALPVGLSVATDEFAALKSFSQSASYFWLQISWPNMALKLPIMCWCAVKKLLTHSWPKTKIWNLWFQLQCYGCPSRQQHSRISYLSSLQSSDGTIKPDLKHCINVANTIMTSLSRSGLISECLYLTMSVCTVHLSRQCTLLRHGAYLLLLSDPWRLLTRSVWGRYSGSYFMITSLIKKSNNAPVRTLSHFLSTRHAALFGHFAWPGKSTPVHMVFQCHINTSLGRLPDRSWHCCLGRPCIKWSDQLWDTPYYNSEICGRVLFSVVIVLEQYDGPCWLCDFDDAEPYLKWKSQHVCASFRYS